MAIAGPTLLAKALQENSRVYSFERCPARINVVASPPYVRDWGLVTCAGRITINYEQMHGPPCGATSHCST